MRIRDLINEINKYVEELDFVTARKMIEANLDVLRHEKGALNRNARELYKIVTERMESGVDTISRNDMATLTAINSYASKFDIISLKLLIKNHASLLMKNEAIDFLNKDAKVVLVGMGAITKDEIKS